MSFRKKSTVNAPHGDLSPTWLKIWSPIDMCRNWSDQFSFYSHADYVFDFILFVSQPRLLLASRREISNFWPFPIDLYRSPKKMTSDAQLLHHCRPVHIADRFDSGNSQKHSDIVLVPSSFDASENNAVTARIAPKQSSQQHSFLAQPVLNASNRDRLCCCCFCR